MQNGEWVQLKESQLNGRVRACEYLGSGIRMGLELYRFWGERGRGRELLDFLGAMGDLVAAWSWLSCK